MLKFTQVKKPHIFLIGAGGTGGFFLQNIVRLLSDIDATIAVYDGDTVEAKNLKRQNFYKEDLGKNKAEVLVERLTPLTQSMSGNLKLFASPDYITNIDTLLVDIASIDEDETPIIVDCVDNVATRKLVNNAIKELGDAIPLIVLDSGNHSSGGQVVIWSNVAVQKQTLNKEESIPLPSMLEAFPEMMHVDDENPGINATCADNVNEQPQAMMANVLCADTLSTLLFSLMQNRPIADNIFRINLDQMTIN